MSSRTLCPVGVPPAKGVVVWVTSEPVAEETRTNQLYSVKEHQLLHCPLPLRLWLHAQTHNRPQRKRGSKVACPWWGHGGLLPCCQTWLGQAAAPHSCPGYKFLYCNIHWPPGWRPLQLKIFGWGLMLDGAAPPCIWYVGCDRHSCQSGTM